MPRTTDGGCEVIAEAGVNHNGEVELAEDLVDVAAEAGSDAVKFQTFDPDELVTERTEKADYQSRTESQNQYEMLEGLTLSVADHERLQDHCQERGIELMSTPYDEGSVSVLEEVGVRRYKISSADIVNKPLLEAVAATDKPVILSTGMASLGEIERAVSLLRDRGCGDLTLLHCNSEYPTDSAAVDMAFMETLDDTFAATVGFSDHTRGTTIPIMAASMGASVVEKHFTLDRSMEGPDHSASLEPGELRSMVTSIRDVSKAIGSGTIPRERSDQGNTFDMRRSLHARTDMEDGSVLKRSDIKVVRPFVGISPWQIDDITGRALRTDLEEDDPITWNDLE